MKVKLTTEQAVDMWLEKYHGMTLEKVKAERPEITNPREFYSAFPVTEAQHDEWYHEVITVLMNQTKWSRRSTERNFAMTYLNCAPMIINETKEQ